MGGVPGTPAAILPATRTAGSTRRVGRQVILGYCSAGADRSSRGSDRRRRRAVGRVTRLGGGRRGRRQERCCCPVFGAIWFDIRRTRQRCLPPDVRRRGDHRVDDRLRAHRRSAKRRPPRPAGRRRRADGSSSTASVRSWTSRRARTRSKEPEHRLGNVADPDPTRGQAPVGATVGVAVQDEVGAGPIDRLRQQVATEERVDRRPARPATSRRTASGAIAHPEVGSSSFQAALQTLRRLGRMTDEALHLQLAELAGMAAGEAAPKTLDACHADSAADVHDDRGLTLEHRIPPATRRHRHLLGVTGVVVVVAEHGDDRHVDDGELLDQAVDLCVAADRVRSPAMSSMSARPPKP